MTTPNSHCHFCGAKYKPDQIDHAQLVCGECLQIKWYNPVPIAVMLQPVYRLRRKGIGKHDSISTEMGLLVGRRSIPPKLGEFGLPGGYANMEDKSYEHASLRETGEEVRFSHAPQWPFGLPLPELFFSTTGDPGQILAFSTTKTAIPEFWLESFLPSLECDAVSVIWEPTELCFSSHTMAAERWFAAFEETLSRGKWDLLGSFVVRQTHEEEQAKLRRECEHEFVHAPELFNYHRGEEFSRCEKCGEVR